MGVTNYYAVNERIIGENGPNGRIDYQVDALGSVVGTMSMSGSTQRVYRYKPFGAVLNASGPGADPLFRWVGAEGYRTTTLEHADYYVRARHFSTGDGQWTGLDSLWPKESAYSYVLGRTVTLADPSGLKAACLKFVGYDCSLDKFSLPSECSKAKTQVALECYCAPGAIPVCPSTGSFSCRNDPRGCPVWVSDNCGYICAYVIMHVCTCEIFVLT